MVYIAPRIGSCQQFEEEIRSSGESPHLVIVDSNGNTITKNGRGDVSKDPKTALLQVGRGKS